MSPNRAAFDLGLHGLGIALESEVLRGHQLLAGGIARRDHGPDVGRCGRQRLLADHILASLQRGDDQFCVVHVGRANVDDVDIRVVDDIRGIGGQFGDAIVLAPLL